MKKTMEKVFSFFKILTLALCLVSCSNAVSEDEPSAVEPNTVNTEAQTILYKGYIGLDGNLSSDLLSSNQDNSTQQRSAAPAPLNLTADSQDYEYYVTATSDKDETVNASVNFIERTFEMGLQLGNWAIEAGVRTKGTEAAPSQVVLRDTHSVELKKESPTFTHSFYLRPVTGGTGSIELEMEVTDDIDLLIVEAASSETTFTRKICEKSNGKIIFKADNLASGTYNLVFTFSVDARTADQKDPENANYTAPIPSTPLFSTVQTVNVLNGFKTSKWTAGTSNLIDSNGKFKITSSLKDAWQAQRVEYYVSSTGQDKNTGGPLDPVKTISHVVSVINDISYDASKLIKVHITDAIDEALNTTIVVNAGKKLLIDVQGSPANAPRLYRSEDFYIINSEGQRTTTLGGPLLRTLVTTGESASISELTIDGLVLDGSSIEKSGNRGIENHGKLTLKNSKVLNNKNSSETELGGGIFNDGTLILQNVEISGNELTSAALQTKGGGLYTSGSTSLSGVIKVINNGASNLCISSGNVLNITGALTDGTTPSQIGISTITVPTKESPITLTNGYGYYGGYNNNVIPGTYFSGDCYAISYQDNSTSSAYGETLVLPNVESIYDVISDIRMTFTLSLSQFTTGSADAAARTITVTPVITLKGNDATQRILSDTTTPLTWKIDLYIGDQPVSGCHFTSPTVVIPQDVSYKDYYTLVVRAEYKGRSFDEEFIIRGI